jgi:hypothetical protein
VFNLVNGDGPTVGQAIASHPGVDLGLKDYELEQMHPIYDFIDGVLRVCELPPTRVLLVYVAGRGIRGAVAFGRAEGEVAVPCYASDALALAVRTGVPIYVSRSVSADLHPSVGGRRSRRARPVARRSQARGLLDSGRRRLDGPG